MKIAIATDDFRTVTGHVGRCNGFLIFEISDKKIISTEKRDNNFTNHKHTDGAHSHSHDHASSHSNLIAGLHDCSHLICQSAGLRLQENFKSNNKELIFTNEEIAQEAASKFAIGKLEINENGSCHSH